MVHSKFTGPYVPTFKLTDKDRRHEAYTHRNILNILRQRDRPHVIVPKSTDKKGMIVKWKKQDEAIVASGDWRASDYVSDGFDALPHERRAIFGIDVASNGSEHSGDAAEEGKEAIDDSDLDMPRSDIASETEEPATSGAGREGPNKQRNFEPEYIQARGRLQFRKRSHPESGPEDPSAIDEGYDMGNANTSNFDNGPQFKRVALWRAPGGAKMKSTVESDAARQARLGAVVKAPTPARQPSQSMFDPSPSPPERSLSRGSREALHGWYTKRSPLKRADKPRRPKTAATHVEGWYIRPSKKADGPMPMSDIQAAIILHQMSGSVATRSEGGQSGGQRSEGEGNEGTAD